MLEAVAHARSIQAVFLIQFTLFIHFNKTVTCTGSQLLKTIQNS